MRLYFLILTSFLMAGSLAGKAAEATSPEGVWSTKDAEGEGFDLLLLPKGVAWTNWIKGQAGMAGQHGQWQRSGDALVTVKYDDGSSDAIQWIDGKWRLKRHPKAGSSFDPLTAPAPMEQVEAARAKYVGAWKMNQEPDGSYLMIVLYGDGRAISSVNGKTEGKWELKNGAAVCAWPDNWFDAIEPKDKGWQRRSWVGAEANGDADSSEAEKVSGSPNP